MPNILELKQKSFQEKILNAPTVPGCYMYFDKNGVVLYVGKAKNLLNRVRSYFLGFELLEKSKQEMIKKAQSVEFYTVDSETEALILENNLIKKYRPKYNILMRDDKNYIYIKFEKIRKSNQSFPTKTSIYQDFPRIKIVREKINDGAEYFGPYPNSTPAKKILRKLRKVFPYKTSDRLVYQISSDPLQIYTESSKPCFYYHIGLCEGACEGLETKEHYLKKFNNIKKFFRGEKKSIMNELEAEMKLYVKNLEFEKAAQVRDKINDIKYLLSDIKIDTGVDDVVIEQKVKLERADALNQLIKKLNFPEDKLKKHKNFRIECYDISNIQGTNSSGSMVVNIDAEMQGKMYRRFRIKTVEGPNDFASLQEVLTRRFLQLLRSRSEELKISDDLLKRSSKWKIDESFSQKPDLLIIDGGKGQLSAVYEVLKSLNLHNEIPVVGLAKREEEIFKIREQFKDSKSLVENTFERVILKYRSHSFFLVQRIRDEAHRFAKNYHKKLRNKNLLKY